MTLGQTSGQSSPIDRPQRKEAPAAPRSAPAELRAGAIRGVLTSTPQTGRYSAGASAFVQLRLSSDSSARRGVPAELELVAEHGEIVSVGGTDVDGERQGSRYVAQVKGLREGRERPILIEMKLRGVDGDQPNRLTLTLRDPNVKSAAARGDGAGDVNADSASASLALSWPVIDCAGGFLSALRQIGKDKGGRLREVWRDAARPERSMPREWLFRPDLPKRAARRRQADPATTASTASAAEREIFVEAGRLIRSGYDPALGSNSRHSMTLSKTSNDLRKYFLQEENAAICTGALAYTNYYEQRLAPLAKRGERLAVLSKEAKDLARDKAASAVEQMRDLPDGHPGWGGATLASLRPAADLSSDPKAAILQLLDIAGFPADIVDEVKDAESAYAALRIVEDRGLRAADLPKQAQSTLRHAFSAIEASIRLEMFAARYAGFWDGFQGSLEAIREAHNKNCVCDG